MQIVNFILSGDLEQKVREELSKIAYYDEDERRRELATGIINIWSNSSDPKEIAEEIIRAKGIIRAIFDDD
jgi:hypothetical protein